MPVEAQQRERQRDQQRRDEQRLRAAPRARGSASPTSTPSAMHGASHDEPRKASARECGGRPAYIDLKRCANVRDDRELLGPVLERDHRLVAPVALDPRDRAQVDDRRAMDLPEDLRVELLVELLDRLLDQRLAVARSRPSCTCPRPGSTATSSTGIICIVLPSDARIHCSGAARPLARGELREQRRQVERRRARAAPSAARRPCEALGA